MVLRAVPGHEDLTEQQAYVGPRLMEKCCTNYSAYLQWRLSKTQQERTEEGALRMTWLKEEWDRVHDSP